MSRRWAKPTFGLVVLLAWLGPCGRTQAGLAYHPADLDPSRRGGPPSASSPLLPSGPADEAPVRRDGEAPRPPFQLQHAPGASTGAEAPGGASSGGHLAGAAPFAPTSGSAAPGPEAGRLLFLSDERFKLPPFASRLFRPPR